MEYVQMTLDDWIQMKQKLRQELQGVTRSFVRIGYALRKIEDGKLYEQDGYRSIAEFARAEYGLQASTVSRVHSHQPGIFHRRVFRASPTGICQLRQEPAGRDAAASGGGPADGRAGNLQGGYPGTEEV